jgi:hypothetical protein
MKKKLTTLFIAAAVITMAVGCKGKGSVSNDPKAVLIAFFEKLAKKDIDGAAKYATKESKGILEIMKKGMTAAEGMKDDKTVEKDPTESFKDMEFGNVKIDGDKATVSVKNNKKNESTDIPLKKEDGDWKVDFSMGTLMKMGMDKVGKKDRFMNENNTDGDTTGVSDRMKKFMNGDSLQKAMEEIQKKLKDIDPEKMKDALKSLENLKN